MAAGYNRVILLGNLTRDIELRDAGNTKVAEVGLAINERRKDKAGNWVDETTFVDVTLWGRTAEVAAEYLAQGSPVLIEGRLRFETWEKDGQKRSKLKVVGDSLQMLPNGKQTPPEEASQRESKPRKQAEKRETVPRSAPPPDDDIPF